MSYFEIEIWLNFLFCFDYELDSVLLINCETNGKEKKMGKYVFSEWF